MSAKTSSPIATTAIAMLPPTSIRCLRAAPNPSREQVLLLERARAGILVGPSRQPPLGRGQLRAAKQEVAVPTGLIPLQRPNRQAGVLPLPVQVGLDRGY